MNKVTSFGTLVLNWIPSALRFVGKKNVVYFFICFAQGVVDFYYTKYCI